MKDDIKAEFELRLTPWQERAIDVFKGEFRGNPVIEASDNPEERAVLARFGGAYDVYFELAKRIMVAADIADETAGINLAGEAFSHDLQLHDIQDPQNNYEGLDSLIYIYSQLQRV